MPSKSKTATTTATKRAGDVPKSLPPAKVAKVDPMVQAIIEVVEGAGDLPETCKTMLMTMIPSSFALPADDRHEVHSVAVRMIGELINEMAASMRKGIDAEVTVVAELEPKKTQLDNDACEMQCRLESATKELEEKQVSLDSASKTLLEKKDAVVKAQEDQRTGDASLEATKVEEQMYTAARDDHVKALLNGDMEPEALQKHYDSLLPLLQKLALDESLTATLPGCSVKPASARGAFDTMVMDQLSKTISDHIERLAASIAEGTPAAVERAAVVESAQKEAEDANMAQQHATSDVADAQNRQTEASAVAARAKEAASKFTREYEAAAAIRDARISELKNFETWNLECYNVLKDKKSPAKDEPGTETTNKDMMDEPPLSAHEIAGA